MKKILFITLLFPLWLSSCVKDITVGFLSPTGIQMREDTMVVVKGVHTVSAIPMVDGSTRPLTFEVMQVKDLITGQIATEFSQEYSIKLWTTPYNPDKDTTLVLVNQKLKEEKIYPLLINPVSGQLAFNAATSFIEGDLYGVDVKVSNSAGERYLEKFGIAKFKDIPWEVPNNFGTYFWGVTSTSDTENRIEYINPLPADQMDAVKANTHPEFHIEKTGDSDVVQVKLTFLDADGNAYPGEAVAKWPATDGSGYLNSWFDNSVETQVLSDGVVFQFPTVPFPAFGRAYSGDRGSITLSYYTLHPNYYNLTPEAIAKANSFAAENNKVFTNYRMQVKIVWQINQTGIWHATVKFKNTKKK